MKFTSPYLYIKITQFKASNKKRIYCIMPGVILQEDAVSFRSSHDIKAICKPLQAHAKVKHFAFARVYDNGSCILLGNNANFLMDYLKKGYRITAIPPKSVITHKFHYLVTSNGPHSQAMQDAAKLFGIGNIFNMVEISRGFYDLYCFGGERHDDEIINFYVYETEILEQFQSYFKETAAPIIKNAENNKIVLPEVMRSTFNSRSLPSTVLSKREQACLSLMTQGYSAKQVGQKLGISHRTVETYIENIKNKLGLNSKIELVRYSIKHQLIDLN